MKKVMIIATAAVSALAMSGAAHAKCSSGFIANALCEAGVIDKDTANAADRVHADIGRPLDRMGNEAAAAASDYFVPGSGQYVRGALHARDQFNRSQSRSNGMMRSRPQQQYNAYQHNTAPRQTTFCRLNNGYTHNFYGTPHNPIYVGQPCALYTGYQVFYGVGV